MEVTSRLNNLRIAPRKVRLVATLLKGLPVDQAISQLRFMSKNCAAPMSKLVKAATADATNNFKLAKADLKIKQVIVESAQTYKRFTPKAYGRAAQIRRRGSNVILTLVDSGQAVAPVSSVNPEPVAKKAPFKTVRKSASKTKAASTKGGVASGEKESKN
jgi:large subunit ribosomal protein L22